MGTTAAAERREQLFGGIAPEAIEGWRDTAAAAEARRAEIRATMPRGLHARIEHESVTLERARALYLTGMTARAAVDAATPWGDTNLADDAVRREFLWGLVAPHGDDLAAFDAAIA